ncbi:MAG: sigma-70 family RNA polymerase sigma factor [Lachnospiraceae bacterium]|nr:sigma-70 family RNA polymerase sigma factor [Lachnospiraceae bacterium]
MLFFLSIMEEAERTKMDKIFALYAKKMHQVAFAILQDNNDAEDAVQTAMLNTCKHIKKLQDPSDNNTKWYVIQAVKHTAINIYHNKERRYKKETVLDEDFSIEDFLERYHEGSNLSKEIAKLSSRDRNILMLKYVHGYGYSEIAGILGISREAAKKAGTRAKERLEKLMEKENQNND